MNKIQCVFLIRLHTNCITLWKTHVTAMTFCRNLYGNICLHARMKRKCRPNKYTTWFSLKHCHLWHWFDVMWNCYGASEPWNKIHNSLANEVFENMHSQQCSVNRRVRITGVWITDILLYMYFIIHLLYISSWYSSTSNHRPLLVHQLWDVSIFSNDY